MPWTPCVEHQWEHVDGWAGRYRCTNPWCGAIGYKGAAVLPPDIGGRRTSITPYRCPKCHGPTTAFHRKRPGEFRGRDGSQLCPKCESR